MTDGCLLLRRPVKIATALLGLIKLAHSSSKAEKRMPILGDLVQRPSRKVFELEDKTIDWGKKKHPPAVQHNAAFKEYKM